MCDPIEVEVFRVGDYGPRGSFDEAALDRIAAAYDPARHDAPVTLDHAQSGPAYGWVASLRRRGGVLLATLRDVPETLREAIRGGAYRKRSIELYRALPPEGAPYLEAVSFLGAAAPAVKGLADPIFSEGESESFAFENEEEGTTFAESLRTKLRSEGRWLPAWDAIGLLHVFVELGGETRETLAKALRALPPSATLAPQPMTTAEVDVFSETLAGTTASPASLQRHRRAVEWLAANPGCTYRDALLRANATN